MKLTFGLETEYMLVQKSTWRPLWHPDLAFESLNSCLEKVDIDDLPSCQGLELEHPHRKLMPYVVEGYHLPDMSNSAKDLLPKGVEIRTPVCDSLDQVLKTHKTLFERLQSALEKQDILAVSLSHHSTESEFEGPQNKRRHDYWIWAMEVMTTYGPDINIGLPAQVFENLDQKDLIAKINYYAPALSALSAASPFLKGDIWRPHLDQVGHSYRMFKRSYIAPPIEIHPHENHRLEFKIFDMPGSLSEIRAQFACFLTLLFAPDLKGRASHQERIYGLGAVSKTGLHTRGIQPTLDEFFSNAEKVLPDFQINPADLEPYLNNYETLETPAMKLAANWFEHQSFKNIYELRSKLMD